MRETSSRVWEDKLFCDMFTIRNGLKHEDVLSPFLINFALEYEIRTVQVNQNGLKLNGTHQLLLCVVDLIILVVIVRAIQEIANLWWWLAGKLDWK